MRLVAYFSQVTILRYFTTNKIVQECDRDSFVSPDRKAVHASLTINDTDSLL